jgi:hypothetical protein
MCDADFAADSLNSSVLHTLSKDQLKYVDKANKAFMGVFSSPHPCSYSSTYFQGKGMLNGSNSD